MGLTNKVKFTKSFLGFNSWLVLQSKIDLGFYPGWFLRLPF